jgi:hypothetical protein
MIHQPACLTTCFEAIEIAKMAGRTELVADTACCNGGRRGSRVDKRATSELHASDRPGTRLGVDSDRGYGH